MIFLKLGAFGSIAWKSIGTVAGSIPFYIYIFSRIGFKLNKNILKELYVYAYPFVLIFFLTTISETVDKFLLNKYFDLKTLGLYNFSAVIVTPVAILIQSYWNSVTPAMYRVVSDDKPEKTSVLSMYFKGTLFITLVAIWGLIMVVDPAIKLIANESYHKATYFVPLLAIAVIGRAYFNIYTFNASFYKKTKYLPLINIASFVVGLGTALILLNFIGIWAILISVLMSRTVQGLAAYLLERKLGLQSYSIFNQLDLVSLSIIVVAINYIFLYDTAFINNALLNFVEAFFIFAFIVYKNRNNLFNFWKAQVKGNTIV